MNGKGDVPRPLSVPRKTFEDNWDLAFGKKQRNVPSPLPLRKLDVPLIEDEIKPIKMPEYGTSAIECVRSRYQKYKHLFKDSLQDFEDNRGLRESDTTSEASGSTIQPPSNT